MTDTTTAPPVETPVPPPPPPSNNAPPKQKSGKRGAEEGLVADKCVWGPTCDAALVETLKKHIKTHRSGAGWKPVVWPMVAEAVNKVGGPGGAKTPEKCMDHCGKTIKKNFKVVKALRGLSGFGWDNDNKTVTAMEDVWNMYLVGHPSHRYWKTHPFSLYNDVADLVDGDVHGRRLSEDPGTGERG